MKPTGDDVDSISMDENVINPSSFRQSVMTNTGLLMFTPAGSAQLMIRGF